LNKISKSGPGQHSVYSVVMPVDYANLCFDEFAHVLDFAGGNVELLQDCRAVEQMVEHIAAVLKPNSNIYWHM
jgi:hypothetical protein